MPFSHNLPEIASPTRALAKVEPKVEKVKPELTSLNLTKEELAAILAMRIPPSDLGSPAQASALVTKEKTITKTETKPFDLKQLVKDKFTMTSVLNKQRFEELDRILRSNGLYTMVTKTRTVPTYDVLVNPTGYISQSTDMVNGKLVITPADSLINYAYDLDRLETVMHVAFDRALYHQSQGFIDHDPIRMYTDLRVYFHGQDNHGINASRAALAKFRINTSISLRADIALFEEAIKNQEYASQEDITEYA